MNSAPATLLLVDDDPVFATVAARGLGRRGFEVHIAHDGPTALARCTADTAFAIVDLSLGTTSGLALLPQLKAINPALRIVVLTGYASIASAVEAIKLGAENYLTKPADLDSVVRLLRPIGDASASADAATHHAPLSVERMEWEHIQRVLHEHDGNISATARALKMHRRTLQRKLAKRPVKA